MTLGPGSRLGNYEIVALLGAGGMGEVYRARDVVRGRPVAIKLLPQSRSAERRSLMRFRREAQAVSALRHPNVVALYDAGSHHGMPYVVTELLAGETLAERLERGGAIDWRRAVAIGSGVARGLAAAHDKGIIHRDVKPSNVFLTDGGGVKILDFGVARFDPAFAKLRAEATTEQWTQTATGHVIGTLAYMAPEQLDGARSDAKSDLFALGCVLYEMLAGRHPFEGASFVDTVVAIVREEPPGLRAAGVGLPADLERLVLGCLAKDRDRRPASAELVARGLEEIAAGGAVTTPVVPPEPVTPAMRSPASRGRTVLGAAGILAVLVAAVAWWRTGTPLSPAAAPPRVAVLAFVNLTGEPEAAYLARELAARMTEELAAAGVAAVAPAPGEIDAAGVAGLAAGDLARLRRRLGIDYVAAGTYFAAGPPGERRLHLELILHDARSGAPAGAFSAEGREDRLADLAAELAAALRLRLGVGQAQGDEGEQEQR